MSADRPLNILVLHGMGPKENWVSSWADVELMFPRIDTRNRYLVHDCSLPVPAVLRSFDFDAIVMMSTFMDWVKDRRPGDPWLAQYAFLRTARAKKIVFSQDDYWLSEARDAFYLQTAVDLVHPVVEPEHWEQLLPTYSRSGGLVRQGFTTYLTAKMRDLSRREEAWQGRQYDVVYRASSIPTFPNSLGYIKARLGDLFASAIGEGHGLRMDVSNDPARFIRGDQWYDFIAGAKATLGSKSGSSINVRSHEIVDAIAEFLALHPGASPSDVTNAVFDVDDRERDYTMISPRNVEAAMLGTLQLLVEGAYSGFMRPNEHFFPLREDMSNARDVLELLRNPERCRAIADGCRASLLAQQALYPEHVVAEVLEFVREGRGRLGGASAGAFARLNALYSAQLKYALFKLDYVQFKKDLGQRRVNLLEKMRPFVRAVRRR